jgi:hypothetical protein
VVRGGAEIRVLRGAGRVVATWREGGLQCVITGPASVPDEAVVGFAAASAAGATGYAVPTGSGAATG